MPPKFHARPRKQKARKEAAALQEKFTGSADSNAAQVFPTSKTERDERKQQLKAELEAQRESQNKASGKKRKRLEKYIEGKLKKEENANLIRKLECQRIDTSLLKSARKLGRGKQERREAAGQALREQRAGLVSANQDALFQKPTTNAGRLEIAEKQIGPQSESDDDEERATSHPPANVPVLTATPLFGTGLKRPLEIDERGKPVIKQRERKKRKTTFSAIQPAPTQDSDWEGFSDISGSNKGSQEDLEDLSDASTAETDGTRSSTEEHSDGESGSEDESGDEEDESSEDEEIKKASRVERSSAFKLWATQARNDVVGFTPSNALDSMNGTSQSQAVYRNKTAPIGLPVMNQDRKVHVVGVERPAEIQESRSKLPVVAEEQKIMEAIGSNDTVIICGATGSGKTTQVPQFLFEAGYGDPLGPTPGLIGVTQPRRVAAVSMANRVGSELGDHRDKVAHQIRFDSTVSAKTAVKFMTDGVLLREIGQDFLLTKYSAVVVDEAHERSVNTDILIGMLSRIVETRADLARKDREKHKPLKLVIMSATLRVSDFAENSFLFRHGTPPIVQAEGRQFPVTVHFSRRTQRDYVEEMFYKISRGHKKLPPGGMLVFMTGQGEILQLAKRLNEAFPSTQQDQAKHLRVSISAATSNVEDEDFDLTGHKSGDEDDGFDSDIEIRGLEDDEEDKQFEIEDGEPSEKLKVHVLPLYSQLPTDQQMRVFEPAPEGSRLIVLATNVAETSLTIPDIRYVFDCGRAKEKNFDKTTGVQSFDVGWISKAAASQRTGRAGRTGPGHCYRLYSSAVYERDFDEFSAPEIARTPVEGVVLQLKTMGIPKIANFPFPTPPQQAALIKAERLLEYMGALADNKVTPTGQELAVYPLSPRLARIIVMAQRYGCLEHAVAMVAVLTVQEVFISQAQLGMQRSGEANVDDDIAADGKDQRRKDFARFHGHMGRLDRHSDAIKLLTAFCDFAKAQADTSSTADFGTFTRIKALQEALQLRNQLSAIVAAHKPGSMAIASNTTALKQPTGQQVKILRQIVAAGYIDQVAIRADISPQPPEMLRKPRRVVDVPYFSLFPSYDEADVDMRMRVEDPEARRRTLQEKYVYIHPSSVLAHVSMEKLPQFIIYSHLSRAAPAFADAGLGAPARPPKTRMHPLTPLSAAQLAALAEGTPLLEEGKPVGRVESLPRGADGVEKRSCWVVPHLRGPVGSIGWPLPPARRVVQKRVPQRGWVTESVVEEAKAKK